MLTTTASGRRLYAQRVGGNKTRVYTLFRSGVRLGGIDGQVTTLVSHQALRAGAACSELAAPRQQVDAETFLPWVPLRVFVVGEEMVAAVARVPLYVMGHGAQTALERAEREESCNDVIRARFLSG